MADGGSKQGGQKMVPDWPEETLRERLMRCRFMLKMHGAITDKQSQSAQQRINEIAPESRKP